MGEQTTEKTRLSIKQLFMQHHLSSMYFMIHWWTHCSVPISSWVI